MCADLGKKGIFTPKRLIDYDAIWSSDKLGHCPEWAVTEYTWLYGLADASGSFELTNLRVIWGKVSAIRPHFTLADLQSCLDIFHKQGLLFIWKVDGKVFGHWTGSTKQGRLPAPTHRARFQKFSPQVPKDQLHQYEAGVRSSLALTNIQNGFGFGVGLGVGLDGKGLGKAEEEVKPETAAAAADNSSLIEAFKAFQKEPFGPPKFQQIWTKNYVNRNGHGWTDLMERTINECNSQKVKVPALFFKLKRKVEDSEVENQFRRTPM